MTTDFSKAKLTAFVATRDREAARRFYCETLGLSTISEDPFALVVDSGGTHIRITTVQEVIVAPYTVLGWETIDIFNAVAGLRENGVRCEIYAGLVQDSDGIWSAPGGTRVAWFKDPDGNLLSLSQSRV